MAKGLIDTLNNAGDFDKLVLNLGEMRDRYLRFRDATGWSQISNATVRQPFRPRTTDASSAGKTSKCFRDIALRRCASELLAGVGFSRVAIEV
jgi:hypothetical protein